MSFIWDKNTGKIGPALVKVSSSPSYTLAELKTLALEWLDEQENGERAMILLRLDISRLFSWLAKREQGKESGNGKSST